MLARNNKLRHPSGLVLETPLLVPSFSSKGFRVRTARRQKGKKRRSVSEIREILKNVAEVLTESMLISAYDIYHLHLPRPDRFPCTPKIVFLDSGGYEKGDDHDCSAVFRHTCEAAEWDVEKYRSILDAWPQHIPAVFVNFDLDARGKKVATQLGMARRLFRDFCGQAHCFLVKPERKRDSSLDRTIDSLLARVSDLASFNVIGLTEKELGGSLLDRMVNIAKIRMALDVANVDTCIQVFGALDPVTSCLYFLAGADIFDGLTWLRYAYSDGQSVYPHSRGAEQPGIHVQEALVRSKILSDNYYYLLNLEIAMRKFLLKRDFGVFGRNADLLREASRALETRLDGGS